VGAPAAASLLDGLAAAESRASRRGFLSLLVRMGPSVAPVVTGRLDATAPWYVTRNLLTLLDEIDETPPGALIAPLAAHADARVRWQAMKLQLKMPGERGRALAKALGDSDDRVVRFALTAAQHDCPDSVVPLITRFATERIYPTDLRIAAIRVLGTTRASAAREALLRLTSGGRTFFGREKLVPKTPELLAALTALATGWSHDSAAQRVLGRALASADPSLRAAAGPEHRR
jgi:hypothetical protein